MLSLKGIGCRGVLVGLAMGGMLAVGCGGSDDGEGKAPASLNSGVAGEKKVSELDETETKQLCDAYASYARSLYDKPTVVRVGCTLLSVFTTPDVATCESSVAECEKAGEDATETEETTKCLTDPADRAGCTATVSELEACYVDALNASKDYYQKVSCKTLKDALKGDASGFPAQKESAACTKIKTSCPAAYTPPDDGSGL